MNPKTRTPGPTDARLIRNTPGVSVASEPWNQELWNPGTVEPWNFVRRALSNSFDAKQSDVENQAAVSAVYNESAERDCEPPDRNPDAAR
jgi:hypothetical protein